MVQTSWQILQQVQKNAPRMLTGRSRIVISAVITLLINIFIASLIGDDSAVTVYVQPEIQPTQLNVVEIEMTKTVDAPEKQATQAKKPSQKSVSQPQLSLPPLELSKSENSPDSLQLPQMTGDTSLQLTYSIPLVAPSTESVNDSIERIVSDGAQNSGPMLIQPPDLSAYYPYSARQRGITGTSTIQLVVDAAGKVTQVRVISSTPVGVFEQAASRVGFSLSFRAARYRGKPLAVRTRLKLNWTLD